MQQRSADGTRLERTGWRDAEVSARHREWGFNCPAVDLDFLMVEYNLGKPVGLIEYKHHCSIMPLNLKHPTYRALSELANCAQLPFLIAKYWKRNWSFRVIPVNDVAQQHYSNPEDMSEREFVQRLYRLRRLVLTNAISDNLFDEKPPPELAAVAEEYWDDLPF